MQHNTSIWVCGHCADPYSDEALANPDGGFGEEYRLMMDDDGFICPHCGRFTMAPEEDGCYSVLGDLGDAWEIPVLVTDYKRFERNVTVIVYGVERDYLASAFEYFAEAVEHIGYSIMEVFDVRPPREGVEVSEREGICIVDEEGYIWHERYC